MSNRIAGGKYNYWTNDKNPKNPEDWFKEDGHYDLVLEGLDYNGEIFFNGQRVYEFSNAFVPHTVSLDAHRSV